MRHIHTTQVRSIPMHVCMCVCSTLRRRKAPRARVLREMEINVLVSSLPQTTTTFAHVSDKTYLCDSPPPSITRSARPITVMMNAAVPLGAFEANAPSMHQQHHVVTNELGQQRRMEASSSLMPPSTSYMQNFRPGTPNQMAYMAQKAQIHMMPHVGLPVARARFGGTQMRDSDPTNSSYNAGPAGIPAFRQQSTVMSQELPVSLADTGENVHTGTNANVQPTHENAKPVKNKTRLRWTPELHKKFVDVVNMLGGPESTSFTCI